MPKIKVTDSQLRMLLVAEGCDCSDGQWERRGDHCTKGWIRCNGRMRWKRKNDRKYQEGLAQLGHSHPAHDRRSKGPPCPDCKEFLELLAQEASLDT